MIFFIEHDLHEQERNYNLWALPRIPNARPIMSHEQHGERNRIFVSVFIHRFRAIFMFHLLELFNKESYCYVHYHHISK